MFDSSYSPAWNAEEVAASWDGYAEPLLRQIAATAIKPRQKLPLEEIQEKLLRVKPVTLGQAGQIPGVTPAAVAVLETYLRLSARHTLT